MRKLIIGLGGMLLGLTLWSQGTDLEVAKGLLVEAENLAGDSKVEKLVEAVEISEKISFDEGVRNGYQGLIEMYGTSSSRWISSGRRLISSLGRQPVSMSMYVISCNPGRNPSNPPGLRILVLTQSSSNAGTSTRDLALKNRFLNGLGRSSSPICVK